MIPMTRIATLIALLALGIPAAAQDAPPRTDRPKDKAERAWDAGEGAPRDRQPGPPAMDRPVRDRQRDRVDDPMGWQGMGGRPDDGSPEDRMGGPIGAGFGDGPARMMRRLHEARQRAEELNVGEKELAIEAEELKAQAAEPEADKARIERRQKMVELRRELLTLERAEFTDRFREETGKVLEKMDEFAAAQQQEGFNPQRFAAIVKIMRDDVQALHDASTDFPTLYKAMNEHAPVLPPPPNEEFAVREERLRQEMERLRLRMERIEDELGGQMEDARWRQRERLDGEYRPEGEDLPPPGEMMRNRGRRPGHTPPDSPEKPPQ